MRARGAAAFVSSDSCGYTVLLDSAADWGFVFELTGELSSQFLCPVLLVTVMDDDVTCYELWDAGEHRDTYTSMAGWPKRFGPPEGGNAAELVRLMGHEGCDVASVERILRAAHGSGPNKYLYEYERHQALARALGLPQYAAGFGYRYLAASIADGKPLSTEFTSTGVPYEEPTFVVSSVWPPQPGTAPSEDGAAVVVDVTSAKIQWRRPGEESRVAGDPDIGTLLRDVAHIPLSGVVLLSFSTDVEFVRVGELLRSLDRAGFSRLRFGGASQK
jgi:hypothetical protein